MVLQNWKRLATVGIILGVGSVGYWMGYDNATDNAELNRLSVLEEYIEKQDAIYEKDLEVLMAEQDSKEKSKEIEDEIEEESQSITTPECKRLGDDWLRLYNKSVEAANM